VRARCDCAPFVVDRGNADLLRQVAPAAAFELVDHSFEAAAGIEHVVDDKQLVLERQAGDKVVHRVDPNGLRLLINTRIADVGSQCDRMNAVILESSWTAMPIGAPPAKWRPGRWFEATAQIRMASSIESRSSESAEM